MIARFNIGVWFRPALSAVVLSLAGCASTSVQEVTKEETITYKTVDDGTLNVMANNQPYATEQYTIEKGSDGNWTATALVKPAQPEQPTRDVRLELGQNMQPLTYSEETQGASPLKVFISFGADKATVLVKQGSAPEANKEMAGVFDVFLGDGLFHHPALLVRNHVAKNTTTPSEFKLFAGTKALLDDVSSGGLEAALAKLQASLSKPVGKAQGKANGKASPQDVATFMQRLGRAKQRFARW
mgnify:CR=1 FL=1